MTGTFDTRCPRCGVADAKVPNDVEPEDVVSCGVCGGRLVAKCVLLGKDWSERKAWLTTTEAEVAMLRASYER